MKFSVLFSLVSLLAAVTALPLGGMGPNARRMAAGLPPLPPRAAMKRDYTPLSPREYFSFQTFFHY